MESSKCAVNNMRIDTNTTIRQAVLSGLERSTVERTVIPSLYYPEFRLYDII